MAQFSNLSLFRALFANPDATEAQAEGIGISNIRPLNRLCFTQEADLNFDDGLFDPASIEAFIREAELMGVRLNIDPEAFSI